MCLCHDICQTYVAFGSILPQPGSQQPLQGASDSIYRQKPDRNRNTATSTLPHSASMLFSEHHQLESTCIRSQTLCIGIVRGILRLKATCNTASAPPEDINMQNRMITSALQCSNLSSMTPYNSKANNSSCCSANSYNSLLTLTKSFLVAGMLHVSRISAWCLHIAEVNR